MIFKKKPYRVKLKGRSKIEYIEGDRRLEIDSEFLAGNAGIVIYSSSLKTWNAPFNNEPLSETDKERIKQNILIDLKKNRISAEWE